MSEGGLSREELVEAHMGTVRKIARYLLLPGEDLGDLVQDGVVGLLQAIDRYDSGCGLLATYASHRIRGEILDGRTRRQRGDPPVGCPVSENDAVGADRAAEGRMMWDAVDRELDERTAAVFRRRLSEGQMWEEIGAGLGVSRARAHQIFNAGVEKMRAKFGDVA